MSKSRGQRESPYDRAQRALLDHAIKLSQAQAAVESPVVDQQQAPLLPPLPPTLATPFQTLHGTLDNTTISQSGSGSASLRFSSSSDQPFRLPSSDRPVLPPLPPAPAGSTAVSSISNADTSNPKPTTLSDEIRNSFSSLDRSATKQANMSSEIEDSTNSGALGIPEKEPVELAGDDVVPDSDNEGSGSASFPLGGEGGGASENVPPVPMDNPTIAGFGRLPTLPGAKSSASKPHNSTRHPVVEITSRAPENKKKTKSISSKGKERDSSLSKETIDSGDEDGSDVGLGKSTVAASRVDLKQKQKGKKRTIAVESSEDEVVLVPNKAATKKQKKTGKKADSPASNDGLTDYDEPNPVSRKKAPRTSSTISKRGTAPRSSPDPLAAPLETSSYSNGVEQSVGYASGSASRGPALEPKGTDDFQVKAMQANQRLEDDDSDFAVTPVKKRTKSKKSAVAAADKTRSKSTEKGKGKDKKKDDANRQDTDGVDGASKEGAEIEQEAAPDAPLEGDEGAKGKGKGRQKRGNKRGTLADSEDEDCNNTPMNLDQDAGEEAGPQSDGFRTSSRKNKGQAKKRLEDGDEARSPPSKKRTTSKSRRKSVIASSEPEPDAEDEPTNQEGASSSNRKPTVQSQEPTASTSAAASTLDKQKKRSVSPAVSRSSRAESRANKSVSPAVSRGRTMSIEEKKADRERRMSLVMEAATDEDPAAFRFASRDEPSKSRPASKTLASKTDGGKGKKRKEVDSDSDADDESEEQSEAEEVNDDDDENETGKGKGKPKAKGSPPVDKGAAAKENEGVPTPKPKAVAALARGRDRSASPFSKTPKPGSLAAIIAKKGIGSYRSPGLSARVKVPSLHQNLKPAPAARKVITEKRPVKKKKKGEYSCSDEEKPWYETKDVEEWDSDDHARWRKRQTRIDKGLPADTDDDSD